MTGKIEDTGNGMDLSDLQSNKIFRSDFLFFIRLAGTYTQAIFWQTFPRSAPKLRKDMFEKAKAIIQPRKNGGNPFYQYFFEPKYRNAKATDSFNNEFVDILKKFQGDERIKTRFDGGFEQIYGLPLDFESYIAAVEKLQKKRNYLEHYGERIKQGKPDPSDNSEIFKILGVLLLPDLCNDLVMCAKKAHATPATLGQMEKIFVDCKAERKKAIQRAFSETNTRAQRGRAATRARAQNLERARIRRAMASNPTDYKEHAHKRRIDFIGKTNIARLKGLLGHPKREPHLKDEVEPLYFLSLKINRVIHAFIPENLPLDLVDIRNTIAHNGFFWDVRSKNSPVPVKDVFTDVLNNLPKMEASAFCDKIETLLRHENYTFCDSEENGQPVRKRIKRQNQSAPSGNEGVVEKRRNLRRVAGTWQKALQQAGQQKGLEKAGKNAL